MKTRITGICFLLAVLSQAQTATDSVKKRIRISEASLLQTIIIQPDAIATLEDFRKIAAGSEILQQDFRDYSRSRGISLDIQSSFSAKIGLSFSDRNKKPYKSHPLLRAGVTYRKMTNLSMGLDRSTARRWDTLTSSQGAPPMYVDSMTEYHVGMHYQSEELRADISLLFRTNPEARWSLYGGIGFTAGSSFNAYVTVNEEIHNTLKLTSENGSSPAYSNFTDREHRSEQIRTANGMGYSVNIPVGIDFRLGKKRIFWRRLHAYYEAKPYFNSYTVAGLRTISNVGFENGIGARISF